MATEKLIPQYLNKDEDERLVKPFEMTDALNIRVSHEDGGDQGIVKNVEGNEAVSAATTADAIPSSGDNRVIGAVPCEAGKCIYFFLYNSNLNHGIYRYDSVNDNYVKLYEDSVLNFERDGFVKGDVVINQFQEHLLYFTDNRNEPRKVNATRLLYGGYNSLITSGTDEQKNKYLTVCKQPPQEVVTWSFQTNNSVKANHLKENCFQFAYQYVYDDGEVSAMSAYSSLAVSSTNLAFNSAAVDYLESYNNELRIVVTNSDGPVDKIRVFARRNNDGAWQKIKELNNDPTQEQQAFLFRNDKVYPYVSSEESNKLYDAAPRAALAQTVSNGRLIYGNYIEGFDNLAETDVYNYPVYHPNLQVASEVDFEIVDNEPMNENVSYSAPGTDQFWENVRAYYGGVLAKAFTVSNTYTTARFGDSTTDGISFDIDLSEFPTQGTPASSICSLDISLNCDRIGFAADLDSNASQTRLTVPATTYDENGDEIHSQNLFILDPASDQQGVGQLLMSSPCQFVHQFPLTSFTTVEAFAQVLVSELNNNAAPAVVGLAPNSIDYGLLVGATAMLAGTTGHQGTSPDTNSKDRLIAWMSGAGTFQIYGASYNENTQKITCRVRCVGVELSADTVVAPYHTNSGTGQVLGNDFVASSDVNTPDYAEDQRGGCLDLAAYHVYSGSQVNANISTQTNGSGYRLKDYSANDGAIRSYWTNYSLQSSTVDIIATDGAAVSSFKAGATHDFGIVYYDDRNRPSGVQPINERYVKHFGEGRPGNNNGKTEIDFRLIHEPPYWAKKWAPVYSKNTSYDKVLQVVVNEAATGKQTEFTDIRSSDGIKTRPILQGLEGGINGQIFISMRGLEGKSNSYRDFKGAKISYEFNEGDILRVLQYEDSDGVVQRPLHEFAITSYKHYQDDDQNPIRLAENSNEADETNYRRSGWFLTVRDNNTPGFSRGDVLLGRDFFAQNCLVEICTPRKETPEESRIYYEVKKQYDIVEVGGVRTHAGDRSNSVSPTFDILVLDANTFFSSQRLYLGDKVITDLSSVFVDTIRPLSNGQYAYTIAGSSFQIPGEFGTVSATLDTSVGSANSIHKGVVTLTSGDVFLRIREQLSNPENDYNPPGDATITFKYNPTQPDNQLYRKWVIEDESVNDFFDSKAVSVGRPFIETPDQKEIRRHTAITYSAPFASDSSVLMLSSFNPVLYPYKDYNSKNGAVCYLIDKGEGIFTLQEKKVSSTPIGRQLIESANDGMLVTSTNVLGTETYFAGAFGPGLNPESVIERFGVTYFCDMDAGKVFALSSQGIEPISDKHMSSFFEGLFADLLLRDSTPRIPCGIDPENDEFVVTTEAQDVNDIIVDGNSIGDCQKPPVNARVASPSGKVKPIYGSSNMMTWEKDPIKWNDANITESYLPEWDTLGESIMFIDKLTERGSVFVDPSKRTTTVDAKIDILTSDNKYRGAGLINPADGSISLPSNIIKIDDPTDSTVSISVTDGVDDDGHTLTYSTTKGFWLSFHSFNPELYTNLHNRFFSFENGQMYRHNVNDTNNNFYGTQYDSMVELVSRQNPSTVKVYNAIGLEGDSNWDGTISNSSQTTNITAEMFENREGMRYTVIPKDISDATSDSSGSNIVVLGEVDQLSGTGLNRVRFKNRISNLPFGIGDEVRILNANSSSATGRVISKILDRKTIQLDGSAVGMFGTTLVAVSNDEVNGDHMRDYYAKVKLTNDSTSDIELYAVNMNYTPSPLHEDGQPTKQQ